MKKANKKRIPLKISLCVLAVLILISVTSLEILISKGYGASVGRALVADSCTMLIVEESPIIMSDVNGVGLFENLKTGDCVLVIHDGITDNYPSHTGAYFIVTLAHGSSEDLPQKTLEQLSELGWI